MKQVLYFGFAFLIAACNLPATQTTQLEPVLTATEELSTATASPAPSLTATLVPPTLTATPIPCDPLSADYCITSGHFLLQRPIHFPDNETVDLTYLYASTSNGKRDPHHGVEYQNPFGTSVFAVADGEVVFADMDTKTKFSPWNNFYGNVIVIRHANDMYTLYAHLSEILVQAGDKVHAGDEIGKVGQTGGATGSHLHFEVRMGNDYTEYFSTENPELWTLPPNGTGALAITLDTTEERNYERQLVITRFADGSDDILFTYYITTYAKGFEHNLEDAGLSNLPPGRYKIAFNDSSGLRERIVFVEAGKLTEVYFEVK